MRTVAYALALAAAMAWTGAAGASGLQAIPKELVLTEIDQKGAIQVTLDGAPVSQFTALRFIEPKYAHQMYEAKPDPEQPGKVRIRPIPGRAEDGSFTLLIAAGGHETRAVVRMRLAAERGPGRPLRISRPATDLFLPVAPRYALGRRIAVQTEGKPERGYQWLLNDQVIAEGLEMDAVEFVANELGNHTLTVREFRGEQLARENEAVFEVTLEPQTEIRTSSGRLFGVDADAPETGPFTSFHWYDGEGLIGEGAVLSYRFTAPGVYHLTLVAEEPEDADYPYAFRHIPFVIHVD